MEELVLNLPDNWKCKHERRIQMDDYTIVPDDDSFFTSLQISYIDQSAGAEEVSVRGLKSFLLTGINKIHLNLRFGIS